MKVLQLTVHFPPNVGGVETHLADLVRLLIKNDFQVFVLCYRPLSVNVPWKIYEKNKQVEILRIPWISGLFYKLIPNPKLEFLYLVPGLFIATPFILLLKRPQVIHAHGIVAGFVAVFWGRIFHKRVVISTHNIYSFPKTGLYHDFASLIFKGADQILCLSKQSSNEIENLSINKEKITNFTYWIDLKRFKKTTNRYKWQEKFIVLFVGRLILEKGLDILLESVKSWDKNIGLVIAGAGPLENWIKEDALKDSRIHFLEKIDQEKLPDLYSAVNVLIIPSTSEEGFGRVIIESLACSTPVIGSNKGAIAEAMDDSVGRLINISPENIKKAVEDLFKHPDKLKTLANNSRAFAERRYSEKNGQSIIKAYQS